jgi:hypothetical protein
MQIAKDATALPPTREQVSLIIMQMQLQSSNMTSNRNHPPPTATLIVGKALKNGPQQWSAKMK